MRTHQRRLLWLLVCLRLVGPAAPARAFSDRMEPFDRALAEAYRDIKESGRSQRHRAPEQNAPRLKDILKTSERVFDSSPGASGKLGHLRKFAAAQAEDAGADPSAPARDLLGAGEPGLAALVGISVYWHEAQHHYDRAAPYRAALNGVSMELPMPLEMERRGWEAGCLFWKAGVEALVKPGGADWPRSYYCEDKFPAVYYCRLYFSVEIVVLTAHELKTLGRTRAQVQADATPSTPFEKVLRGYCGEYERASTGNALDAGKFSPAWTTADCLDRALKTVLDSTWRGSGDLCAEEHPQGADIRAQARELREWK